MKLIPNLLAASKTGYNLMIFLKNDVYIKKRTRRASMSVVEKAPPVTPVTNNRRKSMAYSETKVSIDILSCFAVTFNLSVNKFFST